VNKSMKNGKRRRLELNKETVVHLTDDQLKKAVGGQTTSYPVSDCATQCIGANLK